MKKYIYILLVLLVMPFVALAQESEEVEQDTIPKKKEKLERAAFESSYIVDNPTNIVLSPRALEVQMQHRFAKMGDWSDLQGIYGPNANIRLAGAYGVHERVTLGFGATKNKMLLDVNAKVAILRQTRSNSMPVNLSYFGDFAYDAREQTETMVPPVNYHQDRYSFFHQLILAKRFTPEFSMQFTTSVSHYNAVYDGMQNDRWAFSLGGRYKITPNTAILVDYSQPLTQFDTSSKPNSEGELIKETRYTNHPGLSLGFEFGTSGHAFQLFISNYSGIVPQENYMWNKNDFFSGDILLGFNITRIYNF
ncbi:DUF5777 family beta-barrel protein [Lutimonas saemankumensis]|uniref:DUF5777 family beta-barrel protein n=1 Tax=Lutimonas saemankumensis TaxID=483016 RepID=UPI001CD6E3BF|nr:DUF5777 family beta-barrel protein [Lutimonas saemankumensis]MCA0931529.1 DUF5777 family beta-barrel protein [Lutimonas saemankumensis]